MIVLIDLNFVVINDFWYFLQSINFF